MGHDRSTDLVWLSLAILPMPLAMNPEAHTTPELAHE